MGHQTKETDFDTTRPSVGGGEPHFSGVWEVFERYEVCRPKDDYPYIRGAGEVKKTYRPLADTPHLFLKFARLGAQLEIEVLTKERLDSWLEEFGVLGVHHEDGRPYLSVYYPEPATPPLMYDTEGGPAETVEYFALAVQEANDALSLYEAALHKDEERLVQLLGQARVDRIAKTYGGQVLGNPQEWGNILEFVELLANHALMGVWHRLQHNLSNFAYPTINHELPDTAAVPGLHKGATPFAPYQLGAAWGFRNLLGAMWLQFYWLITSRADLKHCKYCGRYIVTIKPISQDGRKVRKPRSDKEYCNKQCQQNYDYHKRKKPKSKSS